ncbi:hypothetical protein ACXYTJ_12700 [Gilvimarinus sp. F26214L]|uniref:hypothetical protein n=1 Tax=Gilvimarinus sp. DZF01 TaxID=3461371 RepID=UPI0040462FF4
MAHEVKRLFTVLEEGAFEPVLGASPASVAERYQDEFANLQEQVGQQRELFRTLASDEEVYETYHEQLATEKSERVSKELKALGFPSLADCKDQFEATAATVFSTASRQQSPSPWAPNTPSRP